MIGLVLADIGSRLLDWPWVTDHVDEIRDRLIEHIELTVLAVGLGVLIALPLSFVSTRWRRAYTPTLAITGVMYTIPSLALFVILGPITGFLSRTTALVPLVAYTLLILVRNTVTGLDGVPPEVKEAATGMGYTQTRLLLRVELPLAMPAIIAGVRIATVSTVGLVTVTALIGQGGLGALLLDGFERDFQTPLTVGIVLSLSLAVVADLLLLGVLTLATPWRQERSPVMGFLGDVASFLTDGANWSGEEGIPTLFLQHLQLTLVSIVFAGAHRVADRRDRGTPAEGRRHRGQRRQRRSRAPRARVALPRGALGRRGQARRPAEDRAVHARVHRDGRARGATDGRERVRRGDRRRRGGAPVGAGHGDERSADPHACRDAARDAAHLGRASGRRRWRWSRPRRSRRTSTRAASAATSSTASRCRTR